jgi:predicted nucleic acid-binding protein
MSTDPERSCVLIYLDTNIVIYAVEDPAVFGPRARSRLRAAQASGDALVFSDLVRLECRCHPLGAGDAAALALYDAFFAPPDLTRVPITSAVFDRATEIRAFHSFKVPDALHLAAASESGCGTFLTHDTRLARFTGLTVEVLT